MNHKVFAIALSFSFCWMTQQLIAMEDWWGAEIEGSNSIAVSVKKQCLILEIPETTGLSGDMCAPTIIIKNFPTQEVQDLIKGHFVKFRVDALIVNGDYVENMISFDRPATPDKLRLRINGKDIPQSQELTTPSIQLPLQEHNVLMGDFTKDPVPVILRMIDVVEKSIDQLGQVGRWMWQMPEGIKVQRKGGHSFIFSHVKIGKQNIVVNNRDNENCTAHISARVADTSEKFKTWINEFRNFLKYFSPEKNTVGFRFANGASTVWLIENDLTARHSHFHKTPMLSECLGGVWKAVVKQNFNLPTSCCAPCKKVLEIRDFSFSESGQIHLFVRLGQLFHALERDEDQTYVFNLEFFTDPNERWITK